MIEMLKEECLKTLYKSVYFFDGSMLISVCKMPYESEILKALTFQQTTEKSEIGLTDRKIKPELFFIFESKESLDSLIAACTELKEIWDDNNDNK